MSDNPTLWKIDGSADAWNTIAILLRYLEESPAASPAERADVLAALPDKEWYCFEARYEGGLPCSAGGPHRGPDCHWAVKP